MPGGFSRLRLVASRDTFITLCRDNSNPTESTIISGRISADETNKKSRRSDFLYSAKDAVCGCVSGSMIW